MARSLVVGVSFLVAGMLAWSCAEEAGPTGLDASDPEIELPAGPEAVLELPPPAEAAGPESAAEVVETTAEVAPEQVAEEDLGPEPGALGYGCQDGDDCDSGFCITIPKGKVCTSTCLEDCPLNWECVQHQPSLPDEIYICAPTRMNLCKPCRKNSDCMTNGVDLGDRCLPYGDAGSFCGAACMGSGDCPQQYECKQALDLWGTESNQCVLLSGQCTCEQWFVDETATTNCQASNQWGVCSGERTCSADGLTDCSAKIPAAEQCNGDDDDCDGDTDEEAGGAVCWLENDWGACSGKYQCDGGKLACDADEAAPEVCDGKDNDCDGENDDGFPDSDHDGMADCIENDKDGDGVVDGEDNCPSQKNWDQEDFDLDMAGDVCDPDDDNDLTADGKDCSPLDQAVHPGAEEICDGKDNDCDGFIDEGFSDSDADALANCFDPDDDNDGFPDVADCEPTNPEVFMGSPEKCDGKDNDCDFATDEGFPDLDKDSVADCVDPDLDGDGIFDDADSCPKVSNPKQEDSDGDGTGDACDPDADGDGIPDGLDNCPGLMNPGQKDLDSDGLGDACDADVDGDKVPDAGDNCKLVPNPTQADQDNDGFGDKCDDDTDGDGDPDGWDCAPLDPYVGKSMKEVCDGLDNNCNGLTDEGFPDFDLDGLRNCVDPDDDNDGDTDPQDCAPFDPGVHAGAIELCNGLDDDCDGGMDENLGTLACGKGVCFHTTQKCSKGIVQQCDPMEGAALEVCDGKDNDCDGLTDEDLGAPVTCGKGICQHTEPPCVKGKPTVCDPLAGAEVEGCDSQDNDCDGLTDEEGAQGCAPYYQDGDWDGHGTKASKCLCEPAGLFKALVNDDCDDLNPWIFPGATELCDGVDNDCDSDQDEPGATGCSWYFADADADGYGAGQPSCVCAAPGAGWSVLGGDCDEAASEVHPGAVESCDDADNDCDAKIDETFDLATDPKNCGSCGTLCQPDNAFGKCLGGGCQVDDCVTGYADCNGKPTDGCEVDTADDEGNCGGCNKACNLPNAQTVCLDGTCTIGLCNAHWADADGLLDNGCEKTTYGYTQADPGKHCKDILGFVPTAPSGTYWIDPKATGKPLQAYCDMTYKGGGWTRVWANSLASNLDGVKFVVDCPCSNQVHHHHDGGWHLGLSNCSGSNQLNIAGLGAHAWRWEFLPIDIGPGTEIRHTGTIWPSYDYDYTNWAPAELINSSPFANDGEIGSMYWNGSQWTWFARYGVSPAGFDISTAAAKIDYPYLLLGYSSGGPASCDPNNSDGGLAYNWALYVR